MLFTRDKISPKVNKCIENSNFNLKLHIAHNSKVFMFEDGQFNHMNYLKFISMSQYHMAVDDKLEYFLNDISSDEIPRLEKVSLYPWKCSFDLGYQSAFTSD